MARALLGAGAGGGVWPEQLFTYIMVSQTLITFQFTVGAWAGIEAKVRTGEIVVDLVRPIDFQGMILATACGTAAHTLLTNMLPKFALFALAGVVQRPASLRRDGSFRCSAGLGFLVLFGIEFLIGVLAFWLVEVRGLYSMVMWGIAGLFSGYFLPLCFLPHWLGTFADALPFAAMAYTPAAIYAGSMTGGGAFSRRAGADGLGDRAAGRRAGPVRGGAPAAGGAGWVAGAITGRSTGRWPAPTSARGSSIAGHGGWASSSR